ncbi:MAG: DUF1275 family protein [Acidobacteriaceae bacterium]
MSKPVGPPQSIARAIPLICLLCGVAGCVDAAAYLLCGQVFVANMTGGTVLLAISLLQGNMAEAALRGGLVVAFLVGVVVARLLARIAGQRLTKRQRISVLGVESIVLLMLAWKSSGAHTHLLLLLLGCILGVQNAAFRSIGGLHLNTTFITGDLELLGEAITESRDSLPRASAFLLSWVAYAGGALLGALGARDLPQHAFLLPMILAVAAMAAVALTPEQA